MAIVRAVKSGNWSDPTVWNTGALPTSADDVYSNTFTVTIDISPTVLSISNEATTGVTAGGFFVPTNGITLTCTATNGINRGSLVPIQSSLTAGQSFNVVANINPSGSNSGISNLSNGGVNFTGIVSGGNQTSVYGIRNDAAGPITVTGNVQGGSGSGAHGIQNSATGAVMVTGNVNAGGSSATGINNSSSGSVTVFGRITPVNNITAIASANTSSQVLVSGPLLTSENGTNPITAIKWGWINNPSAAYYQVRVNGSGAIRPLYTADSVGGNPATSNVRSGTVYGPSNELTGTCAVPAAASVLAGVPVDNTTGTVTITAADIRAAIGLASANLDTQLAAKPTAAQAASAVRTELATELARLDTAISSRLATSGYTTPPTASAIATAVNSALDRTGFSLTSAERQAIATAVEQSILNEDDGQAILNAIVGAIGNQNIDQAALVAAIRADLERSGGTLATRSTLTAAQVRTELAPELGNMDATVSSRLPSSGYTAPPSAASIATTAWSAANRTLTANPGPSAADNATAVRTELSTELSRIDATVSSRLKPSDTLARVTLTDTATSLTNAPTVPTPGQIADEVRTELTPELSRIANCATTQEVGDIVQDALEM